MSASAHSSSPQGSSQSVGGQKINVVKRVRVLGIDPGSRLTGFGIVDVTGREIKHVAHGVFKLAPTTGRAGIPLDARLLKLYRELTEVIETFRPQVMSLEKVFFAKNALSALKLGQARGAAMMTGAIHGLDVYEYSPAEIKVMVTGHGGATKEQVAKMLNLMFGKQKFLSNDASDGLAIAVCHARVVESHGSFKNNVQKELTSSKTKKNMSLTDAIGRKRILELTK